MRQQVPIETKVEVFNLADGSDKVIYEDLLKKQQEEKIKIIRDEFTYDKLGTPKITVWYEIFEK
jgi:hypothetical protein